MLRWMWPNGARLRFGMLERHKDMSKFQGQSFTWIGWDELTQWPDDKAYRYLRARLRSKWKCPTKRIRSASNPGGPGHHWVKKHFVSHAPTGYIPRLDIESGHEVMYIPGLIRDNPYLSENDPTYIARLAALGSPSMVKAWLNGDWSVTEGAFFENWDDNRHVIPAFEIPDSWTRFMVGDHGSAEPFAILWFAVAQDTIAVHRRNGAPVYIKRGALVCYREWYGWDGIHANVGIKLSAEKIAEGIVAREINEPRLDNGRTAIKYRIMDVGEGATSGPTVLERMAAKPHQIFCNKPDGLKARVSRHGKLGGWDALRHRLGETNDFPMLFFFETCTECIRTIPSLQHDDANPEDVAPGEDHAGDAVRMACMSRPYVRKLQFPEKPDRITEPNQYGIVKVDIEKMFKRAEREEKNHLRRL